MYEDEEQEMISQKPQKVETPKKPGLLDRIVTIVLLAICVLLAYLVAKPMLAKATEVDLGKKSGQSSEVVANVGTYEVQPSLFVRTSTMGAELKGSMDTKTLYSTEVGGTLTSFNLHVGDTIKAGDVIATVDPSSPGEAYKQTEIKATLGGTIYSVEGYVGQKITTSTALATVGSSGELEVVAQVAERYLSSLNVGMKASFTTSAWPAEPFSATIKSISPQVNPNNRTVKVTLSIDSPSSRLKEGMYVSLVLTTEEKQDALLVPSTALTTYLGENVLFVVDGDKAKRVKVTLGSNNDSMTVIESGLSAGDLVITAGSVTDGTKISVVK